MAAQQSNPTSVNLLVMSSKDSPELGILKRLPESVNVVAIGRCLDDFSSLSEAEWASVNVLLSCGVGKNAAKRDDIQVLACWQWLAGAAPPWCTEVHALASGVGWYHAPMHACMRFQAHAGNGPCQTPRRSVRGHH